MVLTQLASISLYELSNLLTSFDIHSEQQNASTTLDINWFSANLVATSPKHMQISVPKYMTISKAISYLMLEKGEVMVVEVTKWVVAIIHDAKFMES